MARIYVDSKVYHVNESDNLLQACLSVGLNIPYFCWHPLLGSLGACRQCAVTQYNNVEDQQGRLIMSCMTPVTDGSIISIHSNESKLFRRSIIELMMTNHPHDCPICEEGGHCHLQDMTVMTQHTKRNYRFKKRIHKSQYLGSFIKHEMNRCISCYRCVRYYKDYSDGTDFDVYGTSNNIYFGRLEDGSLESEHSGNLIEICPTGVFTDKTHSERYNRKWDMQYAPSVCQNCSVGCNLSIGERYGEIRKVENRYHKNINHYLICDLGRFGYSHTNLNIRPTNPFKKIKNQLILLKMNEAIELGSNFFKIHKRVIGIGSTRSSIENNFSLQELVGENNFSNGMLNKEKKCVKLILDAIQYSGLYIPSLKEIESYDAILVIGEDLTETSARIALAVRQAVKSKAQNIAEDKGIPKWHSVPISNICEHFRNSLYLLNTHETKLDNIATWCYFAPVHEQVRLACAIAHELDKKLPSVLNLENSLKIKAVEIAKKLMISKKSLIISGSHSFSSSIIKASINIAIAIKKNHINHVGLTLLTSSSNALGAELIGGMSIESALEKFKKREADGIIIMENDIYRSLPKNLCDNLFKYKNDILSIDSQCTETYKKSSLFFSATSFVESSGTLINFEGRAQRFFQVYNPSFYDDQNCLLDSWKWLHALKCKINNSSINWVKLDDVISAYSKKYPILKKIKEEKSDSFLRINGQKISRSPNRLSGRTASYANISVHEPCQPEDINTMFSFSMEGYSQPNKSIKHIPFTWFPEWNSPQSLNKFQKEVGRDLISGDSGVHLFKKNNLHEKNTYYHIIPKNFILKKYWYIIPYYHLFGNEEMTQYSSIIRENSSLKYALISNKDRIKLGLKRDSIVHFNCLNKDYFLSVCFSKNLDENQIGLPIGRKGFPLILAGKEIKFLKEYVK
ncbi:NADH-quinone oxidoreductase subunit NuoG [Buchnera aphidicola (Muscaphis stroyani)]|uniref:NADH-quinone oxidoreductase n=1 Tax=Buchnera aphidicola (Muscaphis stroyani) TaxID=1241869 RepID=A0A4D6Y4I9_9GAMM|nr:NADH-quinone oxidoreductase subunit NuoG [Buchnera aphidicola]QCI24257.1 NADH-quinone oxidoreductase subunit NuoG [Buchnera aphidicola (Muscaphis stroyani)]